MEIEMGQGVDRVTHKKFVEERHRAMNDPRNLASSRMGKAAEYNKRSYDKKAKSVELVVGDQVLKKNVWEKGGTGKMRLTRYANEILMTSLVLATRRISRK